MPKNLFTIANSGLEQRIHLFDNPLNCNQINVNVKNVPEDKLLDEHAEKFKNIIYIPHWKEFMYSLDAPHKKYTPSKQGESSFPLLSEDINPKNLDMIVTTSYHVQATRKKKADDLTPLGMQSLMLTSDNKYVFGVRGGLVSSGKVAVSPCGSLALNDAKVGKAGNPIFDNFYAEALEELAIKKDKITEAELIGYQTDPDCFSVNFLINAITQYSSSELRGFHEAAFNVYKKAKEKGLSEKEARNAIIEAGYSNIDAWEHGDLIFVNNDRPLIERLVESRKILHKGKEYQITDFGRGPLIACINKNEN